MRGIAAPRGSHGLQELFRENPRPLSRGGDGSTTSVVCSVVGCMVSRQHNRGQSVCGDVRVQPRDGGGELWFIYRVPDAAVAEENVSEKQPVSWRDLATRQLQTLVALLGRY